MEKKKAEAEEAERLAREAEAKKNAAEEQSRLKTLEEERQAQLAKEEAAKFAEQAKAKKAAHEEAQRLAEEKAAAEAKRVAEKKAAAEATRAAEEKAEEKAEADARRIAEEDKARDTASSKCVLVAPGISEKVLQLIAVTVQPESEMESVETMSLPLGNRNNVASDDDSYIAPAPNCLERCCVATEPSITNEGHGECEMCSKNIWGCSIHRTYSSALLLRHCATQLMIARGPPGLELPVKDRKSSKSMCHVQMRAVSELAA
jgi:hypothetical protein